MRLIVEPLMVERIFNALRKQLRADSHWQWMWKTIGIQTNLDKEAWDCQSMLHNKVRISTLPAIQLPSLPFMRVVFSFEFPFVQLRQSFGIKWLSDRLYCSPKANSFLSQYLNNMFNLEGLTRRPWGWNCKKRFNLFRKQWHFATIFHEGIQRLKKKWKKGILATLKLERKRHFQP